MAIQYLARREYSRAELVQRLQSKSVAEEAIAPALDQLAQDGLQSDDRFAEVFVRSRIARGQGPNKIRADIRQRGIDDAATAAAIEAESPDWRELAAQALGKRFDEAGATPRDRARRERFLAGRGFEFDHVRYAMNHAWDDHDTQ